MPGRRGWTTPFTPRDWRERRRFLQGLVDQDPEFRYLTDIIDSVIGSDSTDHLGVMTSMHDLIVTDLPASEPPLEVVFVRAPNSPKGPPSGMVLIEHLSLTGHDDRVVRPASEAVPLFWRFMIEKFGVSPGTNQEPT